MVLLIILLVVSLIPADDGVVFLHILIVGTALLLVVLLGSSLEIDNRLFVLTYLFFFVLNVLFSFFLIKNQT